MTSNSSATVPQTNDALKICEGVNPLLMQEMESEEKKEMQKKLEESARIGSYMKDLMVKYEDLRGARPGPGQFWDAVVISAGDAAQQTWYEAQLQLKRGAGELPIVPFLIIPDPPGPRIGSGGSTLHILRELQLRHGAAQLASWRVLLIHAGGYSKRLPSHSCSGKIFSPLPIETSGGGGAYQMLDLKLALYLPFLALMQPGLFVTASDDIEVYNMDPAPGPGAPVAGAAVTALAHPSSLYIGTTHGVYVLPPAATAGDSAHARPLQEVRPCLEVLQKPSVELMRERGAVTRAADTGEETVYSDSAFWVGAASCAQLLQLYEELGGQLGGELCIYGDFLTCLGSGRRKHHVSELYRDVAPQPDPITAVRRALHARLGDTALAVLSLHQSKFYHLGTTQEYLHGLTQDRFLRQELNLASVVSSSLGAEAASCVQGIVLNSVISEAVTVPPDTIVEYSHVQSKICLGARTILSNVWVQDDLEIPPGFLYHTVAVLVAGQRRHVTVAFHVTDDMKFSASVSQAGACLQYGGRLLEQLFRARPRRCAPAAVFPAPAAAASLWSAKLFTAHTSMSESFKHTVQLVSCLLSQENCPDDEADAPALYSMEDLVTLKDCDGILEFRKQLNTKISSMS